MAVTVVDSGNLEQVFAEANGEPVKSAQPTPAKAEPKSEKIEKTAEDKAEPVETKPEAEDDVDDVEGDDGLTPRQKRELSAKMLKAIGKKHRQVKEAEEFAAHQYRTAKEAERRASEAQSELERIRARSKPEAQKEAVEPKRENFATEAEFIDARIQWGVDQGMAKREAEHQETARQAKVAQALARAKELVADFEKVTDVALTWPAAVAQYMRESDLFAELGYHFATHQQELDRLRALPPMKQFVEIGKIESTLAPFGSRSPVSDPKAGDKPEPDGKGAKPEPSALDTGFPPSKARSDAPVIKPLNGDGRAIEPDPSSMTTREMIQDYQRSKGVSLTARKRH